MGSLREALNPASTLGGKIKKIRKHRKLTQKELGIMCGFPEESARVRISQYENNKIVPKDEIIKKIADALKIDPFSLYEFDLYDERRAIHVLFELEDLYGLHPIKIDDKIYLRFSDKENVFFKKNFFLYKWHELYQRLLSGVDNDKEKKLYDLWRYSYRLNPYDDISLTSSNFDLQKEKIRLEEELRKINEKLNNTEN
mgnify:CR=1 FL=1